MKAWTGEFPDREGWYWFYGVPSSFSEKPRMMLVSARNASNGIVLISEGRFLYEGEGCKGLWQDAVLPDPPASPGKE